MSNSLVTIPLSQLRPSAANIRRTDADVDLKSLAASIEAHGLLQNLTVQTAGRARRGKKARYEVVAGGRRLSALRLLVRRKRISADFAVPCRLLGDDEPATAAEISLAENVVRAPVHPADQFDAFLKLQQEGRGPEEIAARFGVSPTVVLQRLKLATVSPRLMATYREGAMNLDQLSAFAISDDHEAQERVWFDDPNRYTLPGSIRRALTRTLVEGSDRRARFVGAKAYEAAGGTIVRDLFRPEDEGYFSDSVLLDRLVAEKLAAAGKEVESEGWSWVELSPELDYTRLSRHGRIPPTETSLPDEEERKLEALATRYDELVEGLEEEPSEETSAEIDRIDAEITVLAGRKQAWSDVDKSRGGALVTLSPDGQLNVVRGLVKPEQVRSEKQSDGSNETSRRRRANGSIPDTLLEELSAHRTAALRAILAGNVEVALTALLYTLALQVFHPRAEESCIEVHARVTDLSLFSDLAGECNALAAVAEHHQRWVEQLPPEGELWAWISERDRDVKLELLAYCVATTVNAVWRRHGGDQAPRLNHAAVVADAISLDMADWWKVSQETYLGRIPKKDILAVVAEAVSPQAAENIEKLKKPAMATRAEELLAGSTWLPIPLRPGWQVEG